MKKKQLGLGYHKFLIYVAIPFNIFAVLGYVFKYCYNEYYTAGLIAFVFLVAFSVAEIGLVRKATFGIYTLFGCILANLVLLLLQENFEQFCASLIWGIINTVYYTRRIKLFRGDDAQEVSDDQSNQEHGAGKTSMSVVHENTAQAEVEVHTRQEKPEVDGFDFLEYWGPEGAGQFTQKPKEQVLKKRSRGFVAGVIVAGVIAVVLLSVSMFWLGYSGRELITNTVYVQEYGKYYHKEEDCKVIAGDTKEVTVKEAKDNGYEKCPVCCS